MIALRGPILCAAACLSALALQGCSRTADGTVVMPEAPRMSLSMPKVPMPGWIQRRSRPEPEPVLVQAFPPPPAEPELVAKPPARKPMTRRVMRKAQMECVNHPDAKGRIRVVCK